MVSEVLSNISVLKYQRSRIIESYFTSPGLCQGAMGLCVYNPTLACVCVEKDLEGCPLNPERLFPLKSGGKEGNFTL